MAALVDANVLVYRFDARFPQKQAIADPLLRESTSSVSSTRKTSSTSAGTAACSGVLVLDPFRGEDMA